MRRAALDLAYLGSGLLTSVLAFAVWVTGLTLSLTLAILIVGLPVLLASAIAFRLTADLDRRRAVLAIGRPLYVRYRPHRAPRFLGRLAATWRDPQTWRDLGWLMVHSIVGFAFGVAAVTLVVSVAGVALLPLWYWSLPAGAELGIFTADELWEAAVVALLAVPLAFVTMWLLRGMTIVQVHLAAALLEHGVHARAPRQPGAPPVVV
jgi:hypothetical protein